MHMLLSVHVHACVGVVLSACVPHSKDLDLHQEVVQLLKNHVGMHIPDKTIEMNTTARCGKCRLSDHVYIFVLLLCHI